MTGQAAPDPIAAPADWTDAALRTERLHRYSGNWRVAVMGQTVMALFLSVVLRHQVSAGRLIGWLACLALVTAARWWLSGPSHWARREGAEADAALWRLRAVLLSLGAVWGLAGVLLFPEAKIQHQVFLAFVLASMAAGTLTLTAFDAVPAITFAALAILPLALRLLAVGSADAAAMAGMVLLFAVVLALTSLRAQRYLLDAVSLRSADAQRADLLLRHQDHLRQLSEELGAQSEALQITLDSMAQGILSIGSDERTRFYNQRLLELLDLPASLMATRPTLKEIARFQDAHGHFGADLERIETSARPALAQWLYAADLDLPPVYFRRTLSGKTLEVKTRYLADGGLVRTFSDVTPYVEAQRKLSDSEAQARKLALVAAHTDNAVTITGADRRIEWVNEGFTRLTGYRLDEVVGRRKSEFLRGPQIDLAEVQRLDEKLEQEGGAAGEVMHRSKDGRDYWFFVETRAIRDATGQVRQYISIGRDVSERKAAEQELREARDAAQRASQAKSEFLSAMSHELRTPMNAILGFGQLLASDPGFVLPPRQQDQVGEILRAGRHLLALIDDVLDLTRVEAGKQQIAIEPVTLHPLVDDCLALMRPVAQERGITLELVTRPASDCFVAADRTRLTQVLLNLLSNAIKYNRDGGRVRVDCLVDGDNLRLEVIDTGPGLSAAQRERLFNAFDRLGAETGPIPGAGIGLVLSRRIVELMHGEIGVTSEPGQGSTFWLRLPRAQAPAPPRDPAGTAPPLAASVAAAQAADGKSTVLYIEDNPVNLMLMEAMLEHEPGVRLITALEPALGLRLAQSERPRLILLDIQLPVISGFEVLRRLRADEATRATPVIAISANAMRGDIRQALDAGFDAYLTKPLDLELLRNTVRQALRR
jgi:PAS domain S-box-containing protein